MSCFVYCNKSKILKKSDHDLTELLPMTLHSKMHDLTRSSIDSWVGEKAKPQWGGQTVFANDLILTATV